MRLKLHRAFAAKREWYNTTAEVMDLLDSLPFQVTVNILEKRSRQIFKALVPKKLRQAIRKSSMKVRPAFIDPGVRYVGITHVRYLTISDLRALNETLVCQDRVRPLAVMLPYSLYMSMQNHIQTQEGQPGLVPEVVAAV